jgi:hypothetical protein
MRRRYEILPDDARLLVEILRRSRHIPHQGETPEDKEADLDRGWQSTEPLLVTVGFSFPAPASSPLSDEELERIGNDPDWHLRGNMHLAQVTEWRRARGYSTEIPKKREGGEEIIYGGP